MNTLVLGGNRFIGAELVSQLLAAGHQVTVLAIDPPPPELMDFIHFVRVDRHQQAEMRTLLAGQQFDAVFDNIAFRPEHVESLLEVLGARCGRYVLTSTVDLYPSVVARRWREEDGPLEPSTLEGAPEGEHYSRGKRGCEKVLRSSQVPFSIVRPAMVTGVRDPIAPYPRHWTNPSAPAPRSLHLPSRVLDGGPVLLNQDDRRFFQLAWVQDVARAMVIAGTHPDVLGEALNVAGDELWSHEILVLALANAAGKQTQVVRVSHDDLRAGGLAGYDLPYGRGARCSLASNERLKALGWLPTPPRIWLPQLLDSVRDPARRPFYAHRAREIALARRLLSHSIPLPQIRCPETPIRADASEGTRDVRIPGELHLDPTHYRSFNGRKLSSIGIGTHQGDANAATDELYAGALRTAFAGGLNVVDTAINYRAMRSERVVGRVVREQLAMGIARDAMFVVTKGGFVSHDAEDTRPSGTWINEELVRRGHLSADEAVMRHSISATWISESLRRSYENLGLKKVDAYLIHNPERFVPHLGAAFWPEITRTFAALEDAVSGGKIGYYGLALWNAEDISIERALECARIAAGGGSHHFRVIEFPLNVSNARALRMRNQLLNGRMTTLLTVAEAYGLFVLTSASVARAGHFDDRGRRRLPCEPGIDSDCVRALQFTRSAPGVGSALVGMRKVEHVREALVLATRPPLASTEIQRLAALV